MPKKYPVPKTYDFNVKVFKATDSIELCEQFVVGHRKVLEDFGVTNVSSDNGSWMTNPNTYCIVYLNHIDQMLGGIRVETAFADHVIPIASAVGKYDMSLIDSIIKWSDDGIGEVCGMWTDRRVAGIGVGKGLVRFAVYVLLKGEFSKGICLVTDYTKMLVSKHGFVQAEEFGNNGTFQYPDSRYLATVMVLHRTKIQMVQDPTEIDILTKVLAGDRKIVEQLKNHDLQLNLDLCFDSL